MESRAAPSDSWLPWPAAFALAACCAAALFAPLNHDVAWYLVVARRLLGGETLYVDILDMNPPLIAWLLLPFAAAGKTLGLADSVTAGSLHALCLALGTLGCARVLALAPAPPRWLRSLLLAGFAFLATFPGYDDLGQRDPLAGMLFAPYVFLAGRALHGLQAPRRLAIAAGLMAAVGIALKPYLCLPWVAVELCVAVFRRSARASVRVESLCVALGQAGFGAAVLLVTPAYVTKIVPLVAASYGSYEWSRWMLTFNLSMASLWSAAAAALVAARLLPGPRSLFASETLAAAALGFFGSFVWQAKGFSYHVAPALVFAPLALGGVVLELVTRRPEVTAALSRFAVVGLVSCLACSAPLGMLLQGTLRRTWVKTHEGYGADVTELAALARAAAPGEPIYFLSTSIEPAFPVVNLAGATWPYHYQSLWSLPGFYRDSQEARAPAQQDPLEREVFDTVTGDLLAHPPRLLVVDRGEDMMALARPIDFVAYFAQSPEVAALLARYKSVAKVGRWEVLQRD